MLCLDTNVIVSALSGRSKQVADRLELEMSRRSVAISSIVLFELRFGSENSDRPRENEARLRTLLDLSIAVLDFESGDAEEAGLIRADLRRKGTPIGPYDILIAAQARRHGATLVTANTREFSRVQGLRLEDWTRG